MADQPTPAIVTLAPPENAFSDDVGGEFATDAHRRVLANLPTPGEDRMSPQGLLQRVKTDKGSLLNAPADVERIVEELAAEGLVATENGLRMTDAGLEAIQR